MLSLALPLLVACTDRSEAAPEPEDAQERVVDWSLAGCTIVEEVERLDPVYGWDGTCVATLFGDVYAWGEWEAYSWDCTYNDGSWASERASWTPQGCALTYDSEYVDEAGFSRATSNASKCDARGEPLRTESETRETQADGTESTENSETWYTSTYDDAGRLVEQEADTTSTDQWGSEWSLTEWTYEGDLLMRWEKDVELDADSWWWISPIEYSYDTEGKLTTKRSRWSGNSGDYDDWSRSTYAYDNEGRLERREDHEDEDGVVTASSDYTWVGQSPWIESYSSDFDGDAVPDGAGVFEYSCP